MAVIGGGAVGVELAGEIVDRYSDKNVSLIHSGTTLVTANFGEKFSRRINRHLKESCNVNVILGTVKYEHHMYIKDYMIDTYKKLDTVTMFFLTYSQGNVF